MHIARTVTVYEPDVARLPIELRTSLTPLDIRLLRDGPDYLLRLIKPDAPKWLASVLKQLSETMPELQFYAENDEPYQPYHKFYCLTQPLLGFPRPGRLRTGMPTFLKGIYKTIGEFRQNGFDMAGGLHAAHKLKPITETNMWVQPRGTIDPASAFPFLETLSGSQLCYLTTGGGAWLQSCELHRVKSLEAEVKKYFDAWLKGTRI